MLPDNWRELSYRKLDLDDHTLDKNLPEYETPLQRKPAKRNAGVLETLPLELLQLILARAIARYGQNALRGSLAINTAANIYVEKLHQQLFKKSCENCGAFAPYLYFITCARVCFLCRSVLSPRIQSDQAQIRSRLQGNPTNASNEVLTWGLLTQWSQNTHSVSVI
jgi:hypothetical protein